MLDLRQAGLSAEQIAAQMGCHPSTVYTTLRAAGLTGRPGRRPQGIGREAEAEALYGELGTVQATSRHMGLSPTVVRRLLSQQGVEVKRGNPQRLDGSQQAERDAAILEAYLGGETLQSIGDRLVLSRERVRQIVRRQGVDPRQVQHERSERSQQQQDALKAAEAELRRQARQARQEAILSEMRRMDAQGVPIAKMAETLNLSFGHLHRLAREAGLRKPQRRLGPTEARRMQAEIQKAYANGVSCQEIANRMGFSVANVRRYLAAARVQKTH
jgi:DNA-binding CsgD family transcriptional regulator